MKRALPVLLLGTALSGTAAAQQERFALALGGGAFGGYAVGERRATFTENRAPSGGTLTYFDARGELEGAALWNVRGSVRAWRGLWLEAGASFGSRTLRTSLSNDFENAAPLAIESGLSERQLEAGLRFDVPALGLAGGRGVPFLSASAAHVRQQPDDGAEGAAADGSAYSAGIGIAWRLFRGAGLRLDAGWSWRDGGFEIQDGRRSAPRVTLALYAAR